MHPDWMQFIPYSVIECSVFHVVLRNGTQLNARILCSITECSGFKKQDWMQWILCSMSQSIPIECSGFHALWLNAVNSMQRGKMNPDWMQWIPWSVIECTVFHEVWSNGTLLNAVYFMQYSPKHPYRTQWIPCILRVWNVIHAAL